jgi:predicted Rossmann-fold nucleotide-binding protein
VSAIAVYCASSTTIDPRYAVLAADLGAELGRRGHVLVTGGGSVSMMGAVARAPGAPAGTPWA